MGLFTKVFGRGSEVERRMEEGYVATYRANLGMSEREARENVRAMIQKAKEEARREGTDKWPEQMGTMMLQQAATDPKARALIEKKQKDGVTEADIRFWWNLPDLERRLMLLSSEQARMALFIDGIQKGLFPEDSAARMRKFHAMFGDPDDTTHTSGDDRPLPVEMKERVNTWTEKMRREDPNGFKAELEATSTFNALIRRELRAGRL